MAIRLVKLGGTDWADGENLTASDLNDTLNCFGVVIGQDQTGGNTYSTTETKIGEVVVDPNKAKKGILVIASGYYVTEGGYETNTQTAYIRLRAGQNTNPIDNTEYKKLTRTSRTNTAHEHLRFSTHHHGWTIIYYISDLDFTATNYVQITAHLNDNTYCHRIYCESVVVIGF